jgi:hypothetical protein
MMGSDTVEIMKPFPDKHVRCSSLLFHGDVVYIGSDKHVIQWNVATDAVVRLDGYSGSIFQCFVPFGFLYDFFIIFFYFP